MRPRPCPWRRLIIAHTEQPPAVSTFDPAHHRATKALASVHCLLREHVADQVFRVVLDSPSEGRIRTIGSAGEGPTLRVSILLRSDFSVGGRPTSGDIESLAVSRGTDGSNPVRSGGESVANFETRDTGFLLARFEQLWQRVPRYKPLSVGVVPETIR